MHIIYMYNRARAHECASERENEKHTCPEAMHTRTHTHTISICNIYTSTYIHNRARAQLARSLEHEKCRSPKKSKEKKNRNPKP